MKKIILASTIFFLLGVSNTYAGYWTEYYYPSTGSDTEEDWENFGAGLELDKMQSSDDEYAYHPFSPDDSSNNAQGFQFNDLPTLTAYEYISSVTVDIEGYKTSTYPATNIQLGVSVGYDDQGQSYEILDSDTEDDIVLMEHSDSNHAFYWSNDDGVHTDVSDYFETYTYDPDTLTVYVYDSGFTGSTASGVYIDAIKLRFFISEVTPTVSTGSGDASPSAQLASLSWTGDTVESPPTVDVCKVSVFESCSQTGYASWTSQTSVATVWLENNGNTSTVWRGGSEYEGYDWGTGDSTYSVDNVSVPYNAGFDCEYPTYTVCTKDGEIVIEGDSGIIDPGDNFFGTITDPEPDDPLQWLVWKLKNMLISLFVPNLEQHKLNFYTLKANLLTKAPFAYFDVVISSNTTSVTEETIDFTIYTGQDDYNFTDSSGILTDFYENTYKPIVSVILWLLVFVYVLLIPRRFFPQ